MNTFNKKPKTELSEYTHLVFPEWALPGNWKVLEVETDAKIQSTSYFMWAKLHPDEGPYVDFWGTEWPLGHRIIIRLVEFKKLELSQYRFSVCTSRHTTKDMTTKRFHNLEDAMEHLVNEMIATTKKFDKIHNTNTVIWDLEKIQENDPNFNPVQ
jgi:hypothetical protein